MEYCRDLSCDLTCLMSVGMPGGGDTVHFHQVCGWQQISGRANMAKGRAATQRDSN